MKKYAAMLLAGVIGLTLTGCEDTAIFTVKTDGDAEIVVHATAETSDLHEYNNYRESTESVTCETVASEFRAAKLDVLNTVDGGDRTKALDCWITVEHKGVGQTQVGANGGTFSLTAEETEPIKKALRLPDDEIGIFDVASILEIRTPGEITSVIVNGKHKERTTKNSVELGFLEFSGDISVTWVGTADPGAVVPDNPGVSVKDGDRGLVDDTVTSLRMENSLLRGISMLESAAILALIVAVVVLVFRNRRLKKQNQGGGQPGGAVFPGVSG